MSLPNAHLTRQYDLIPEAILDTPVTIIGAGAIGSFTTLALAKMGFWNLSVWDFDKIEVENMNSQFYRTGDIGQMKVIALSSLVRDFTGVRINPVPERYSDALFRGIVISAVDSMEARKAIWQAHKFKAISCSYIIDPRMGAETALLYVTKPMDPAEAASYEKTLYSDENSVHERCTAKATMYTACMLSGLVAKAVKDCLTEEKPLKSVIWSIKDNEFVAFGRK